MPNEAAVPFKQFKPFKWFKSSPGPETLRMVFQLVQDMASGMPNRQVICVRMGEYL
jgi:hypothetical protein